MIETRDTEGRPNGWLQTVWNELTDPERPRQVYVIGIKPGMRKGPHLHMERGSQFFVLRGNVKIRSRIGNSYIDAFVHPGNGLWIPAGQPNAIYNVGDTEAIVVVLASRAWQKDNPDSHPVKGWEDA